MDYYSKIAKAYKELYEQEQLKKLEDIKKLIKIKKSDYLLDVGCGTGISTKFFECVSIGIDPSFGMLREGKGNLICVTAESLPFKNETFDIILSVTAIHHTEYKIAIKEMERVVKKNGKIIITILKKAKKAREIKEFLMKKSFKEFESEKDFIFLLNL